MNWIIEIIKKAIQDKFTGYIQVNFFQGGISNINRFESIKPQRKIY